VTRRAWGRHHRDIAMEKLHVFICYRQADGRAVAEWLYERLQKQVITLERSGEDQEIDIYFDRDAPAVSDWSTVWGDKLQVARALLFVCTPGSARPREGVDWVYQELDRCCVRISLGKGEETHEADRKPFAATLWVTNPTR
jgi:TIR domain